MKKSVSSLLLALLVCFGLASASTSAFASHLRGTTVSWSPTAVPGQVQFTIQYSQRTDYQVGGCYPTCAVGSTVPVPFSFGDNTTANISTTITSINTAEDYYTSTGTILHTYAGAGPYIAFYMQSARISTIISGHDQYLRMETSVSPRATPVNHSPVVSMPAIITVPLQPTTGFFISASDLDRDTLSYRLSTSLEMYSLNPFSCVAQQPPGLSVNASTGQVTWDTTQILKAGCGYAAPKAGDLWTVQFMVQDLTSTGVIKSKVPLDVILKFVSSTEAPPTITLSNPGPITVQAGTPITFTATGNDAATGSVVTLNATGLPIGASSTNLNMALKPPVESVFTWTPTVAQSGGSYVITYSATNDTLEQALASVTIYVENLQPPVLSCPATLSAQYGMPISVPVTVSDPQADALSVVWSLDGAASFTETVAASNATTSLSYNPTFTTLGAHSVSLTATDTDKQSATCSTAITVGPADQQISFAGPAGATYGTAPIALVGIASSGLPVTYTASGACSVVGTTLTITGAGTCNVTASQAGNADYKPATPVVDSFPVAQATQTISFNPPATVAAGGAPIVLAATGGASGNPVTYTVTGPATLKGNLLTVTGPGNVIVTANQAGNTNYAAATPVVKTIVATLAPQTITFNPPAAVVFGNPVTLAAIGGASGNPVTYTVSGPATLVGNLLTPTGVGVVTVTANQAGSPGYSAATPVTKTINVTQAAQTIVFTTPATASADTTLVLNGKGGASGNPVTYTVTGPATVSGNVLTITGAGPVVVTAHQAGNANYAAAPAVTHTITAAVTATVTLQAASTSFSYPNSTNLTACVTLTDKKTPTGTVTFYDGGTALATFKVNGDGCYNWYIAPSLGAGSHNLTAVYNDPANAGVFSNTVVVTVAPGQTTAEVDCSGNSFDYGRNFSCDANPDSGPKTGYMTYVYDGGAPVKVPLNSSSHALFTIVKPAVGTHTVVITYPAQGNYGAFQLPVQTFTVAPAGVNLSLVPSSFYLKAGLPLTLNATLTSWDTTAPSSAGTVTFKDGPIVLGTAPVNAAGVASVAGLKLALGYHQITATYSGTSTYGTASQTIQVQIGQY